VVFLGPSINAEIVPKIGVGYDRFLQSPFQCSLRSEFLCGVEPSGYATK
jgi:hypothetical protein